MARNSILGNGLEEKTEERSFMVKKKVTRMSSTITRKEIRTLTLTGQPLDARHYARCLILFPFCK